LPGANEKATTKGGKEKRLAMEVWKVKKEINGKRNRVAHERKQKQEKRRRAEGRPKSPQARPLFFRGRTKCWEMQMGL